MSWPNLDSVTALQMTVTWPKKADLEKLQLRDILMLIHEDSSVKAMDLLKLSSSRQESLKTKAVIWTLLSARFVTDSLEDFGTSQ